MKRYLWLIVLALASAQVCAQAGTQAVTNEAFVVSDIRVDGLQRISAGSLFAALPINAGDTIDQIEVRNAIRALFRSGNFDDVQVGRDGNVLVIVVVERPAISEINIEGNKVIETDSLLKGLEGAGLSEGKVFKRSTLEGMKMELTRQYVSQGRYDAGIETDVSSLPRNRVAINININEGNTAAIKHINIVGNTVYDEEDLLDLMTLKTTGFWSWISDNDKYAKEKLSGDLETITSYYLDSGYIEFAVDSTQVSVSPDRKAVYIAVNIAEGEKFTVGEVGLSGDLVVPEEQLRPFIFVRKGQTFSQAAVTSTEEWLVKRLGNDGYNFAKVEGIPELDKDEKIVNLKFFVDPGKRTYVRRINFEGNSRTADDVLRREMRQIEGAPASSGSIDQSRVRLNRLGYFREATVDTAEVPGTDDLIDLTFGVEEQPSGSIGASVGFSQDSGVILGANLQQDNFLGTGKQIGIGINKSDFLTNIRFSYMNPYYTEDGVSRGFSVFYREADLEQINISSYSTDTLGANMNFGYPLSETQRIGFSVGWSKTKIKASIAPVQEIAVSPEPYEIKDGNYNSIWERDFIEVDDGNGNIILVQDDQLVQEFTNWDEVPDSYKSDAEPLDGFLNENGDNYNNWTLTTSWSQSTLNRGRLATRGASQSVSLEVSVPSSDLQFAKLIYNGQIFMPLTRQFTLRFRTELGYGDGYGDQDKLPFYQNFYAGGFGSVRGYKSNTLGPRSTPAIPYQPYNPIVDNSFVLGNKFSYLLAPEVDCDDVLGPDGDGPKIACQKFEISGDPFGGNMLVVGGVELLFPLPFIKDQSSVRTALFIDVGNVFSTYCGDTQVNCSTFDYEELRYSVGAGLTWITGFGPLTFSYALPYNDDPADRTEEFQFSLGRSF